MSPAWTLALVVLLHAPAPVPGSTPSAETPAADAPRIATAIVHADDLDLAALIRAIQLRAPALVLVPVGDEPPPAVDGELRAYIEVRRVDANQVDLTLILADGRAYVRRVDVDADSPVRPIAGALANLIAGIEDDTVVPDRKDVAVPVALAPPTPVATPAPKPVAREPVAPTIKPGPEPPRWQLGPVLRLGATLGLAPPTPGFHGLGPGGGLDVRSPRGLLLALDVQFLARPLGEYFLARTRVALGVGYALRRGNFELPVAAMLAVEPWRLRSDHPVMLSPTEMLTRPRPLLGVGLRLSPGYSAPVGRAMRLRVGLRLEAWTSGQPVQGGLRRPQFHFMGAPDTGIGGAELHLGLEVGLWFGVGKPRLTSRAARAR